MCEGALLQQLVGVLSPTLGQGHYMQARHARQGKHLHGIAARNHLMSVRSVCCWPAHDDAWPLDGATTQTHLCHWTSDVVTQMQRSDARHTRSLRVQMGLPAACTSGRIHACIFEVNRCISHAALRLYRDTAGVLRHAPGLSSI